ncbi:glutathione reductase [Purpureocillium lavendulum]|uniref:Glutathione reductase n=1 Tax=Purpureocillium lavendulum TaxID=1247861 RepID=A0AB34FS40_9HYPO|nr:glutathione reductase [Purpureocillium lavendulum]
MTPNSDNAMARFLFAILKQKNLKDIDWNEVAQDPVLLQPITNGHAARMRYSRFRATVTGHEPQKRSRHGDKGKISKPKKDTQTKKEPTIKSESLASLSPFAQFSPASMASPYMGDTQDDFGARFLTPCSDDMARALSVHPAAIENGNRKASSSSGFASSSDGSPDFPLFDTFDTPYDLTGCGTDPGDMQSQGLSDLGATQSLIDYSQDWTRVNAHASHQLLQRFGRKSLHIHNSSQLNNENQVTTILAMADDQVATPKKEPSASEAMFFFAIVKHTKNKADIDWAAVAVEQGFKNAEVAKVRFGQVKRKLGISSNAADSPASATARATPKKATPKTTTPRKAATPKKSASGVTTPSKVQKSTGRAGAKGRGRAAVKKEEPGSAEDDDDDDATVAAGGVQRSVKSEAYEGSASQFEEEMKSIMQSRKEVEPEDPF